MAAPGGVDVEPLDAEARPVVERLLGLEFDLDSFAAFAATEPVLAGLVERFRGLRPPLAPDPFESLVTSITAQQVSLFAAFAIRNRLIERFGERATHAYSFPARERLADAREEELFGLGFSRRKAEYIVSLARSSSTSTRWRPCPTTRSARGSLRSAASASGRRSGSSRPPARPSAWPAGDLGLRKAVALFYGDEDVRAVGERLDPSRTSRRTTCSQDCSRRNNGSVLTLYDAERCRTARGRGSSSPRRAPSGRPSRSTSTTARRGSTRRTRSAACR